MWGEIYFFLNIYTGVPARESGANTTNGGNPRMYSPSTDPGLVNEQAARLKRWDEALECAVGFEPGESKLTDEQIMARRAARAQANGQTVSSGQPTYGQAIPIQAILNALHAQPGMFEHLEGIDLDGDGQPDISFGPPPMDPRARMQWQTMVGRQQAFKQQRLHARVQRKQNNNMKMLGFLQANDPLFGAVHQKIDEFVGKLSPKLQRTYNRSMDETPGTYLDLYREMRDLLIPTLRQAGGFNDQGGCATAQGACQDPREAVRRAVAGRIDPARLNGSEDRVASASRASELAALKARCKSGQAREGDLLRYIELMMPEDDE